MAMNILETEEDFSSLEWDSATRVHAGIEAMRLAFADVLAYDADPEVLLTWTLCKLIADLSLC